RGCVSLLEWQLGRQSAHIQQLEDDITRLMEHASTNESLFYRLLRLQSDLAAAGSLQELLNRLQRWARSLGLAGAHVRLFSDQWQLGAPSGFTHLALARSKRQGLQSASLALRISALRSFLDCLVSIDALGANPARGVSAPHHGRHLPKNMDVDEVDHLLNIDTRDPPALRDCAMLQVMYGAGMRFEEPVGLNCADVDLGGGEVRVVGKGNKELKLPIGATAVTWLTRWLALRGGYAPKDDAVFIANSGRRISARNVQKRFAEWGVKQGVNSHIHPHKLRHSFATHMLESSGNLRAVQELLGHTNLSTPQIYTHLDFQHLASVYDAAHPRAKREKT
ncbi:DUF484 family protein, partial [Sodalis-like symbiont of Bactericera trigonica]